MGTFNLWAELDYRVNKQPKKGKALLVGVIAGDSLTGRGSERAKEVVQLFDVFKEANQTKKITTFVKTLESGKLFVKGNDIDFISIGIEGAMAHALVATATCHDLTVIRAIPYAAPKTPVAGSSVPREVDSSFTVVTLDFKADQDGFKTARTGPG